MRHCFPSKVISVQLFLNMIYVSVLSLICFLGASFLPFGVKDLKKYPAEKEIPVPVFFAVCSHGNLASSTATKNLRT